MKIFIAGCARSGTTVLRSLMANFVGTTIWPREAAPATLDEMDTPRPHRVAKRLPDSYLTLADLPAHIELIYCVRHPFDVLTSIHWRSAARRRFHVTPQRWEDEYRALAALREGQPDRRICYVRYEDIVSEPDRTQAQIAAALGLAVKSLFSCDQRNPLFATSMEKWRSQPDLLHYLHSQGVLDMPLVQAFCDDFDYHLSLPTWDDQAPLASNRPLQNVPRPTHALAGLVHLTARHDGGAPGWAAQCALSELLDDLHAVAMEFDDVVTLRIAAPAGSHEAIARSLDYWFGPDTRRPTRAFTEVDTQEVVIAITALPPA